MVDRETPRQRRRPAPQRRSRHLVSLFLLSAYGLAKAQILIKAWRHHDIGVRPNDLAVREKFNPAFVKWPRRVMLETVSLGVRKTASPRAVPGLSVGCVMRANGPVDGAPHRRASHSHSHRRCRDERPQNETTPHICAPPCPRTQQEHVTTFLNLDQLPPNPGRAGAMPGRTVFAWPARRLQRRARLLDGRSESAPSEGMMIAFRRKRAERLAGGFSKEVLFAKPARAESGISRSRGRAA